MKAYLLGFRDLNFKANDNSDVVGRQLFISHDEDGVTGKRTDKLFVRNDSSIVLPAMKPGDTLEINFSMRGRVEGISVVK